MWITVLGLAIAVNFEPMRLGLITLALGRPRPVLQLLAFLCGSFLMSVTAGLIVLFVVRPGVLGAPEFSTAKIQVVFGVLAVLAAAVLASKLPLGRFARTPDAAITATGGPPPPGQSRTLTFVASRVKGLVRGSSPWFSGAMGLAIALPSIDYLALLILIGTSGAAPLDQLGLLITFVAVANTVVAIPIASFLVAPAATQARLEAMRAWVLARTRRDVALILTLAGAALVTVGVAGL
ncbi:GAP family protein [Mycobacterium sp. TNTM28]|uniref:GAP family protein n=1 Tax=[Mycobacterium] fortunisiensis TaxID=2600579 RepID=A0ABS6KN76_9MYCO|nr:GAP family protein [[Mycobacterium] fortunisiensis]MBU9764975.1 GAP family protein [[Mycobacterium] fortunisiensis]